MISVIVPVYNGEKYIENIFETFSRQIEKDFELILINDGSSDGSLKLMESLKDNYPIQVVIIDQKNQGVSEARNNGIKAAKGDFISFCDVDDDVTDTYLSDMHEVLKNNDVDMVICKYIMVRTDGSLFRNNPGSGEVHVKDFLSSLRDYLYGGMVTNIWSLMIRKKLIIDNELLFAKGYKHGEDAHMVWRLLALSKNVAYLDKALYHYYLQEGSATSKFDDDRFHAYELMKSLGSFMEEHAPDFASEYKKYAASRIMWSLTWQAATRFSMDKFKEFIKKHQVKRDMRTMISFNSTKVSVSSILFFISKKRFRKMAIQFGSRN